MSELKDCPFCGQQPEPPVDAMKFRGLWTIFHRSCGTLPNLEVTAGSREKVIERWNRRSPSPAVKALVEACRRMVEHVNERWPEGFTCGCCDCAKCWELSDAAAAESALAAVEREIGGA